MWTEEHRAIYRRDGKGFPSDLRDAEWVRLEPLIPRGAPGQDRHAGGDERHFVPAAHRLPVALPAARGLSAALDGLQHLSQVPTRGDMGGDLGRGARGVAGT